MIYLAGTEGAVSTMEQNFKLPKLKSATQPQWLINHQNSSNLLPASQGNWKWEFLPRVKRGNFWRRQIATILTGRGRHSAAWGWEHSDLLTNLPSCKFWWLDQYRQWWQNLNSIDMKQSLPVGKSKKDVPPSFCLLANVEKFDKWVDNVATWVTESDLTICHSCNSRHHTPHLNI